MNGEHEILLQVCLSDDEERTRCRGVTYSAEADMVATSLPGDLHHYKDGTGVFDNIAGAASCLRLSKNPVARNCPGSCYFHLPEFVWGLIVLP